MADTTTHSVREKGVREPLFHIEKREKIALSWWKRLLLRFGAILVALIVSGAFSAVFLKANPIEFFTYVVYGAIGTETRIWNLLKDAALLLGVALAIVPAFKMRFWNLGGNGQVLVGCLATTCCMYYLGGKMPLPALLCLMLVAGVVAGAIWALLPAIFKAVFKTNESLFTLMMNYIAEGLVTFSITTLFELGGSSVLNPMHEYKMPVLMDQPALLPVLIVAVLAIFMYVYLRFGKQGYEISVVGESENTARYVGINVKKVTIRTLLLSGAICGLMGFLLSGVLHGTVNASMHGGLGFAAIMVAWLAKFNPLFMTGAALGITFLERGVLAASQDFGVTNFSFPDITTSIIFFFIIGCEFFIEYVIKFRSRKKEGK